MKMTRTMILAAAASAMAVAAPVAAVDRTVAPIDEASELGAGPGLSVLALVAVVAGLIALSDVLEDDDAPVSA